MSFVPDGFVPLTPVETDEFRLALLGPEHNESDYAAWTSSMDYIRTLPGWETSSWPDPIAVEDNLRNCVSHMERSTPAATSLTPCWLVAGGADLQVVKERLGHGSIAITDRYLHPLPIADETALTALRRIRGTS